MAQHRSLAIVAGAGPGLGKALQQRLSAGGYHAVGLTRSAVDTDKDRAIDLTNIEQVQSVLQELIARYGVPEIVIHNPAHLVIQPLSLTTLADFENSWRSMVASAFVMAQVVMPVMVKAGQGAFIVSGATASLRGGAKFSAFASAKFALRGLAQSLAREFQPSGIHVVHAILDGIIDTQQSRELHGMDAQRMMKPEDIAEVYWQLAHQPSSAWTHEVDLRPYSETF